MKSSEHLINIASIILRIFIKIFELVYLGQICSEPAFIACILSIEIQRIIFVSKLTSSWFILVKFAMSLHSLLIYYLLKCKELFLC